MALSCTFEDQEYRDGAILYACKIKYQSVPSKILKVRGKHLPGKTNDDVQEIRFVKCNIPVVPAGLTRIFPNMIDLSIWKSNLKFVCNKDLIEYRNLKQLYLYDNKLEFVPGNLFDGFTNLEEVGLNDNKLEMIEPTLLFGLDKLKVIDISDNPRYRKNYSEYNEHDPNASLEEVRAEIAQVYAENVEEHLILRKEFEEQIAKRGNFDEFSDESSDSDEDDDAPDTTLRNDQNPDEPQNILFKDIQTFIQTDTFKDFRIQIDDQEFPVHKFLLAARSPTLAEILKNNPEVENLNLVDISVEIFEIILKFLYTDELPGDDGTNFLHLFAAAGKLRIQELKNYAATKLIDNIEEENVLEVLNLSNKYEHEELRQKSFEQIKKNYPKIIFKDKWESETEIVTKIIEVFKKKEEAIKKLEEEFENVRMSQ